MQALLQVLVKLIKSGALVRITYEVSDGYMGKSRPQFCKIDDSELDELETDEERNAFIDEYVQQDFDKIREGYYGTKRYAIWNCCACE